MHSQSTERNTTTSEIAALRRVTSVGGSIGKKASIEKPSSHFPIYAIPQVVHKNIQNLLREAKHQSNYQIFFGLVSQEPTKINGSAELAAIFIRNKSKSQPPLPPTAFSSIFHPVSSLKPLSISSLHWIADFERVKGPEKKKMGCRPIVLNELPWITLQGYMVPQMRMHRHSRMTKKKSILSHCSFHHMKCTDTRGWPIESITSHRLFHHL